MGSKLTASGRTSLSLLSRLRSVGLFTTVARWRLILMGGLALARGFAPMGSLILLGCLITSTVLSRSGPRLLMLLGRRWSRLLMLLGRCGPCLLVLLGRSGPCLLVLLGRSGPCLLVLLGRSRPRCLLMLSRSGPRLSRLCWSRGWLGATVLDLANFSDISDISEVRDIAGCVL